MINKHFGPATQIQRCTTGLHIIANANGVNCWSNGKGAVLIGSFDGACLMAQEDGYSVTVLPEAITDSTNGKWQTVATLAPAT